MFSILWRLLILNLFLIIYMFKGRLNFIVKYVHSWSFSIGFLIPHLSISFLHLLYVCVILFFKNWVCVCFCVRLYFQISLSLSLSLFFNLFKCFSLFRFPIISVYALSPLFKFISLSFFSLSLNVYFYTISEQLSLILFFKACNSLIVNIFIFLLKDEIQ